MEEWVGTIDAGEVVGTLLIDLSKAFDTVPHPLLIKELAASGCGMSALQWFSSYLSDRFQRVARKADATPWKPVQRGVPQGSCLSPLLFNIYVRNLPAANLLSTKQYADDITDSISGSDPAVIARQLTEGFNATKQFCDEHELEINATKSQLMIFKAPNKQFPGDFELTLDGCSLKPLQTVKLLGVTLDPHLTLGPHIDTAVRKAHGLLGALARAAPSLPRPLLKLAYTALIRSHLEFCSALLTPVAKTHLKKLDTIQRSAARIIFGLPRDAHAQPLLDELKLDSLETRRNQHVRTLVNSILKEDCHPALSQLFALGPEGQVVNNLISRTAFGGKRFSIMGAKIFNLGKTTVPAPT